MAEVDQGAIPQAAARIRINGRSEWLRVDARVTLLDALRDRLGISDTEIASWRRSGII